MMVRRCFLVSIRDESKWDVLFQDLVHLRRWPMGVLSSSQSSTLLTAEETW